MDQLSEKGHLATVETEYHTTDGAVPPSLRRVRITYAVLLVIGLVLAIIVKTQKVEWIAKWAIAQGCNGSSQCVGMQSVYRVSFAMALFFFVHWCLSCSYNLCLSPHQRVAFNGQGIIVKLLSLIPFFLVSFAIPNSFFVVFAWTCLIVSIFFLIGQLIVLLDFCYTWNTDWSQKAEDDSKYYTGLLVCTALMIIGGLTVVGLCFKWFGLSSSCQANQAVISLTLVLAVLYLALSIITPTGSILPAAAVFLYTSYTCFSALSGTPSGSCNALGSSDLATLIISTALSAVSLVCMTVNAGSSRAAFHIDAPQESLEEQESNSFAFFHMQMMMGSCYLAMLVSNWTIVGSDSIATISPDQYQGPLGAKLTSEFLCIALYIWTLIAPILCPDRDFS